MSEEIILRVEPGGQITGLYSDALDWEQLGTVQLSRASTVEPIPGHGNRWMVDLSPVGGSRHTTDEQGLPFTTRAAALAFERRWLNQQLFQEPLA